MLDNERNRRKMITILCAGSRGDIQPYIALAQELLSMGKEVRIAAGRSFESFLTGYGIGFYPISADYQSADIDQSLLKDAQSSDNPLKMLLTFNRMKKYASQMASSMTEEMYNACQDSELVVYHPGCAIGYFAAKSMGIPAVLASPFPLHKTAEVASVIAYGRYRLPPVFTYTLLQGMLWMTSKSGVSAYLKKQFGSLPDGFGCPFEKVSKGYPAIVSCSNAVFNRPGDWNENVHQYGYWFVRENEDFSPSKELADFLNNGEPPVYVGFGSVFHEDEKKRFVQLVVEALQRSGKRGVICGMGEIKSLPDSVYAAGSIPHSWLFERVSAVCHHGGAGTAAAGFRAGVPSIIIPFSNDQFAWAHRAYDIGVGSYPIPKKKLTAYKLSEAIDFAMSDSIIKNAGTLAKRIASEEGARECAKVIVDCLER
jgi:sterol 3beta-glucosyltransferase